MKRFILNIYLLTLAPIPALATNIGTDTSEADAKLDGEWLLYNMNGENVVGDERPYLMFNLESGRLYGYNGCNVVNAGIYCEQNNSIKFTDIISTHNYCSDTNVYLFNMLLEKVHYYKISDTNQSTTLELMNNYRQVIMVLRKHNMEFLNGIWGVVEIDNEKVDDSPIRFAVDIPLKSIHCQTGCNIINGEIFINPEKNSSISFHRLDSTKNYCNDNGVEMRFLIALEEVEFAVNVDNENVELLDKRGHRMLKLRRVQVD